MMFRKIKYILLESYSLFKLYEGVKVLGAVLMLLLSNDILDDGVLLHEELKCCLRSDITFWECEEPAFGFVISLWVDWVHFAIVILTQNRPTF